MKVQNLISYLYVALGGSIGSVARVYISSLFPNYIFDNQFPLPILLINVIGCFCMGVCAEYMGVYMPVHFNVRLFLISGFLGGFTTFSAFSLEFALLWQKDLYALAIIYCILSFFLSIAAFFSGFKIVKLIF